VCVCACVHVCVCVYHIYMCIYIHMCVRVFIHIYVIEHRGRCRDEVFEGGGPGLTLSHADISWLRATALLDMTVGLGFTPKTDMG